MAATARVGMGRAGRWLGATALTGALAVLAATPADASSLAAAPGTAAPNLVADSGCGFSFFRQQYTVCGGGLHYVVVYYFDGLDKSSSTQSVCWGPGTYGLFGLVPPGGLANAVADLGACHDPSGPPPFPPS